MYDAKASARRLKCHKKLATKTSNKNSPHFGFQFVKEVFVFVVESMVFCGEVFLFFFFLFLGAKFEIIFFCCKKA